MRILTLTFVLVFYSAFSHADGNSFLKECKLFLSMIEGEPVKESLFNAGNCVGIIQGMRHMNSIYNYAGIPPLYCIPNKVKGRQLVKVVVKYLEHNTSMLHEHEAYLIGNALHESFECKPPPAKKTQSKGLK